MYSQEGLLDLEDEKYVVSLSLIWAGLSSSLTPAILEYLSTGDRLQWLSLRPMYLLPQNFFCLV